MKWEQMHDRNGRAAVSAGIAALAVAALVALAASAMASTAKPKHSGFVVNRPQGYSAEAKARTSSLARVRVAWTSGVTVSFGRSSAERDYGGYQLTVAGKTVAGFFTLPSGSGEGKITLGTKAQESLPYAPVKAVVGTGKRPTLVITGFPAGTTELQMSTGGAGSSGTRVTAKCVKKAKRVRATMLITLASGAHEDGLGNSGYGCGLIKGK